MQVPPGMRPVGLAEGAFAVDPMLEILGEANELAGITCLGRLQKRRLCLAHCLNADVLGGPCHQRHVLVTKAAASKGRLGFRQLVELARDLHPLGSRGA